jgi:adenosylhomocysteine nucleosidase
VTAVLVLTAVDLEATRLARHLALDRVAGAEWPHFRGGAIELIGVGLRGARVAERTARSAAADLVVAAGACGALQPSLGPGALVVPGTVITPEGARFPMAPLPGLHASGTLLAVDEVVATPADKARLWMETGAMAVDMESAAIAAWATARELPIAVIRGVSDTAAEAVPPDLAALVEPGGRVSRTQALRTMLARPRAITDALTLKRGTDLALHAVATALAHLARTATPRR